MSSSMVIRLWAAIGLTLLLSTNGAEIKRSLRVLDTWGSEADDLVGDGMSGALVGGLPEDDVTDDDDQDEVDKALRGVTEFHRSVGQKHLRQAKEDKEDEDDDADDDAMLATAKSQKLHAEAELKSFEDDAFFEKSLAADVNQMSNETQSPALAKFLGEMKENQRKYARPEYIEFLKKQIKKADKTIKKLGGEADDSSAKKEDADDDDEDKDEDKAAAKKEKKEDGKKEGKEKKKDKDDDDDDDEEEKIKGALPLPAKQSAGETFAIAFFANVAMLACVFAMASTQNKTVSNYTWFLIDQVVAIFLAVMHFQAFDSMLDFHAGVGNKVVASVLHSIFLLFLVLGVAYYFQKRGDTNAVAVLCGAGAHFCSFSAIHSSSEMQNTVFVAESKTVMMCLFGIFVLALGIGIIAVLVYKAKQRANMTENDEFMDKSDDVENDAGATAFSVVFTMLVRFILTGHHPDDDETEFDHTSGQRTVMLIWAFICLIIAGVGVNIITRKCPDDPKNGKEYAVKRVCNFFKTVLVMNTAWAFLYWGEWEFFEELYPKDPIKGRVMFAVVTTMIGGVLLIALSRVPDRDKAAVRTKQCALLALGLVIAFSWELCFDSAIEQMTEDAAHPVTMKVISCLVMLAIIVPVYICYMKPIVDRHSIEA